MGRSRNSQFCKTLFSLFLGLFLVLHRSFCPLCSAFFPYPTPKGKRRLSTGAGEAAPLRCAQRVPRSGAAAPRLALTSQQPRRSPRTAPAPRPRAPRSLAGSQPGAASPGTRHPERAEGRGLSQGKEMPPKARAGADSKSSPDRGRAPGAAPSIDANTERLPLITVCRNVAGKPLGYPASG